MLVPQPQRVGGPAEADLLVKMLDQFLKDFAVDKRRMYATTVSYGSQLLWNAFAKRPDLFAGGLVTGGFAVNAEQAAAIAAAEIPLWITHGVHDYLLNINPGPHHARAAAGRLRRAGQDTATGRSPVAVYRV